MPVAPTKLRRSYVPGAPLFAKRPLKFRGVSYVKGDMLPIADMTKVRHHRMWLSGLASHEKHGPFDKLKARAEASLTAPALPQPAVAQPAARNFAKQRDRR